MVRRIVWKHFKRFGCDNLVEQRVRHENVMNSGTKSATMRDECFNWTVARTQKINSANIKMTASSSNFRPREFGACLPLSPREFPKSPLKSPKAITTPWIDRESYKDQR